LYASVRRRRTSGYPLLVRKTTKLAFSIIPCCCAIKYIYCRKSRGKEKRKRAVLKDTRRNDSKNLTMVRSSRLI